jgi:integrase
MRTPDPKFILKDPKCDKETLIYLIARWNSLRFKVSTGETIHPELWDFDNQTPTSDKAAIKKHKVFKGTLLDVRLSLNRYANFFVTKFTELQRSGQQVTPGAIKQLFDTEFNAIPQGDQGTEPQPETLFEFIARYAETVQLNKKGDPIQPRTRKKYRTLLRHLVDYSEDTGKAVDFDSISMAFYSDFVSYLYTRANYKNADAPRLGIGKNTVSCYIAALKTLLYAAQDEGLQVPDVFRNFKASEEDVQKHYLTEPELMNIYNLDLTKNPRLDRVRDLFLIGCYTGLRFSDFSTLKPENFYTNGGGTYIRKRQEKTGGTVIIPVHWIVNEILAKYEGYFPLPLSNQKMNDYIKEVCQLAGINQPVTYKSEAIPKYKAISTHTARRSFATNCFLNGVPSLALMKITGHKTETAFMRYIQIDRQQNAELIAQNPFFQKPQTHE